MAAMIFKGMKLERELVQTINRHAKRFDLTFSKFVRDLLWREVSKLRTGTRRKA